MNIFVLDKDPVVAAQLQCDKHIVKMILESAQMLSTAHRVLDGTMTKIKSKSGKTMVKHWALDHHDDIIYKAVHVGHPCTVWTMESNNNYNWHWVHFKALHEEYTYRYGKTHKSFDDLGEILKTPPRNIQINYKTPFKLAMGAAPECIDSNDPVGSYRKFYQTKQKRFSMTWSKREIPEWFEVTSE
jgi:hypothetical protein